MKIVVRRGEIFYADLSPVIGSEQGGIRPVVVISNEINNRYAPTIIVAAITSQINKAKLPIHVEISAEEHGFNKDSVVLLEQIKTIDKRRLKDKISVMNNNDMLKIDKAINISLDINNLYTKENNDTESKEKNIKFAIELLEGTLKKGISENYSEQFNLEDIRNGFKIMNSINNDMNEKLEVINSNVIKKIDNIDEKMKKVTIRNQLAKGQLNEFAVIDYFEKYNYIAKKASDQLDHKKVDVIAENETTKIYLQVKNGKISNQEIAEVVKCVKEISNEDEKKIQVGIVSNEFQPDSEFVRVYLEEQYQIKIIFIQKYQVLEACPQYKRTTM